MTRCGYIHTHSIHMPNGHTEVLTAQIAPAAGSPHPGVAA